MSNAPASTYGLFNHFVISQEQKDTAARFGLTITAKGGGAFEVESQYGRDALKQLVEPFAGDVQGNENVTLQRKDLKQFLNFLRQPIAGSLDKNNRMSGHAVSRFLTTGHAEIHQFLDEGLASAASLECHLKGENKMKENDIWDKEPEFWNPDLNAQKVSSIPGTSYDPERGFVLALDSAMSDRMAQLKPNQKRLRDVIKNTLEDISGAPIDDGQSDIALTAVQLSEFYKAITSAPNINALIKAARIEEKVAIKLQDIHGNAADLKTDPRFQIAAATQDTSPTQAVKFDNLIQATTALKPVVGSDVMFEMWRNSFATEHLMKLSDPVNNIHEEFQVFASVLDDMRGSGEIDAEHMQAIVHNFRPLMAFTADLLASMEEGADHKGVSKRLDANQRAQFQSESTMLSAAFEQVSVNGVQAGDLDGDYDELLTSVGNVLGQNGTMAKQQLMGYVDMMKGFWQGVGESAFDSPVVASLLVGFVGYAWYTKYGVDPALMQQSAEMVFSGIDGGAWGAPTGSDFGAPGQGFEISEDFLNSFSETSEDVINDAIQTGEVDTCLVDVNCHYNYVIPPFLADLVDDSVGQYLKFRHYVGSDIIASNANTAVNVLPTAIEATLSAGDYSINENTVFRGVVEDVTTQGGLFVVDANMFQDGSHASMLAYGITRASKNGFGAFRGMGGLAAEFFNPATRIVKTVTNPVQRLGVNIGQTFGLVGGDMAAKIRHKTKPEFESRLINSAMSDVSKAASRMIIGGSHEGNSTPSNKLGDMKLNIGWYGLKREHVEISDAMINDLEKGLNEFALVLKYSADDIGIESAPYTEFVQSALRRVENAISDYKNSGNCNRLETLKQNIRGDLQHVIGAELRFNGRDQLYRTLFDEPETQKRGWLSRIFTESAEVKDERRLNVLSRYASKKEGRMMRTEFHQDMAEQRAEATNRFQKPEKLASLQSLKYAWGGIEKYTNKFKYTGAQGLNKLWGGIVFTAREGLETPFREMPAKKRLAAAFGAACLGGLTLDIAGAGNALTNAFSAAGAAVSGITATGLIAGAINIPQDLLLHTAAIGVSALAVGVPWYYAVNKGAKPLSQGVMEKIRPTPSRPAL